MKTRYKVLLIVVLLWLGMTYEDSRNVTQRVEDDRTTTRLEAEIRAYEETVADGRDYVGERSHYGQRGSYTSTNDASTGNFFSRLGRGVGNLLQTAVRETLRAFVRFFDGVIS